MRLWKNSPDRGGWLAQTQKNASVLGCIYFSNPLQQRKGVRVVLSPPCKQAVPFRGHFSRFAMLEESPSFSLCFLQPRYRKAHWKNRVRGGCFCVGWRQNPAPHTLWMSVGPNGRVNQHMRGHKCVTTGMSSVGAAVTAKNVLFSETLWKGNVEHNLVWCTGHMHTHTVTHSYTPTGSEVFSSTKGTLSWTGDKKTNGQNRLSKKNEGNKRQQGQELLYGWRAGKGPTLGWRKKVKMWY